VPGDADDAVVVGREDLLDVALRDDVAHRGAAVAGHDDTAACVTATIVVPCGASTGAGRQRRRDGRRSGAASSEELA
jgi:hypothetical protein